MIVAGCQLRAKSHARRNSAISFSSSLSCVDTRVDVLIFCYFIVFVLLRSAGKGPQLVMGPAEHL